MPEKKSTFMQSHWTLVFGIILVILYLAVKNIYEFSKYETIFWIIMGSIGILALFTVIGMMKLSVEHYWKQKDIPSGDWYQQFLSLFSKRRKLELLIKSCL